MRQNIAKSLEASLARELEIEPDPEDAPDLDFGSFTVSDNPGLLMTLANRVAEETGEFPTLTAFQKLFQTKPTPPVEPDPEDPEFLPPEGKEYPPEVLAPIIAEIRKNRPGLPPNQTYAKAVDLARKIEAAEAYNHALATYHERHRHHQEIQARSRPITQTYNGSPGSYLEFVTATTQAADPTIGNGFFFTSKALPVSEDSRRAHTFLSGATKSGKSETIKYLIRHYLTRNTRPALVVLDPHGKLAREVAEMREFAKNDRLVFVAPSMFENANIALNPFDCRDKSETGLNTQSRQLMAALERVLGTWTGNAQGMMPHCISLLLHREGSTLYDLLTLMDDDPENEETKALIKYGAERLPYEGNRRFFAEQFSSSKHYSSTKESIRNRLQQLLSSPIITRFLCRESTFELERAIDEGKVIVFNCTRAKMDQTEVAQLGQFIMARIQGYCLTRELIPGNPMTPVHVFADECQYFVNETVKEILGENRKHGLHLTLATQRTDQMAEIAGQKLVDAVIGNVGVFITGRGGGRTPENLSPELGVKPDEIRDLVPLDFFYTEKATARPKPTIKSRIPYIGRRYRMTQDEWGATIGDQIKSHYRPLNAPETSREAQQEAGAPETPAPPTRDPHAPKYGFQDLGKLRRPQKLEK